MNVKKTSLLLRSVFSDQILFYACVAGSVFFFALAKGCNSTAKVSFKQECGSRLL